MTQSHMNREEVANKLLEMANELSCYNEPFLKEHSEHLSAAVLFIRNDSKRIAKLEAENSQLRALHQGARGGGDALG